MYHKYWVYQTCGRINKELLLNPNAKENWLVLVYGTEILRTDLELGKQKHGICLGHDNMPELFLLNR